MPGCDTAPTCDKADPTSSDRYSPVKPAASSATQRSAPSRAGTGRASIHAPTENGAWVASPTREQTPTALRANELIFSSSDHVELRGRSLRQMRGLTREAALSLAKTYTAELLGEPINRASFGDVLIVTGHQPALFHPGVWAKNFATSAMGERFGGCGLNLIVDSDLMSSHGVAVPRSPREAPHLELFPMLDPQPPQPWEERIIDNVRPFETFGARVSQAIESDWGYRPLLADCWNDAITARESHARLSDVLSAVRAKQERRWGMQTLELPLSRLQESEPFLWFMSHLLAGAGRFREIHNAVLGDYRRRNRIRSHSHPVPELREREDGIEVPFWVWRSGDSQRRPLFVQLRGRRVELRTDEQSIGELRLHSESELAVAVKDLQSMMHDGWKFRTRALTTTMFARVCLADLFIHGIGGAKYDEMTNRLIERFYGLTAPAFVTLTATCHLPLDPFPVGAADVRTLRDHLRRLDYNADRELNGVEVNQLHQEKQERIGDLETLKNSLTTPELRRDAAPQRRQLHREFKGLQDRLRHLAAPIRAIETERLLDAERQLHANRILRSREHAWCLFPESQLRQLAEQFRPF